MYTNLLHVHNIITICTNTIMYMYVLCKICTVYKHIHVQATMYIIINTQLSNAHTIIINHRLPSVRYVCIVTAPPATSSAETSVSVRNVKR